MDRITIEEYAARIAIVCATRSEDPHCKVGAVAFTKDNRIIATAYNGLAAGRTLPLEIWKNREERLKHVIHAEQNLCSLFKRGEVNWVMTTLCPCISCLKLLDAHQVQTVIYIKPYPREDSTQIQAYLNLTLIKYVPPLNLDESHIVSSCLYLGTAEGFSESLLGQDSWY
jgi:dCMP deaminase